MFDPIQEEIEYQSGAQSEILNCLEEARGVANSRNPELRRQIARAAREGRIAVVSRAPYFCRATDAFAGMYPVAVEVVDTVAEADAFTAKLPRDEEIEVEIVIPDALKPAPVPAPIVAEYDIPF